MRKRRYLLPIFGCKYEIWIAADKAEAMAGIPEWRETWNGIAMVRDGKAIIAITDDSPYCTIVHECEHLKNFILSDRGVKADYDNDETDAYLIAYLFQKVMEFKESGKNKVREMIKDALNIGHANEGTDTIQV